ncbi:MAG TPA: hypothetical protein VFP65_12210 [Anaeromyxobacteraceae bacterium]|nr:hypothetical protein [Anaeromyxobacteraceae bacterium]
MANHVSPTSSSMTRHRNSILGALAAVLWMSPAAAQAAGATAAGTAPDAARPAQIKSTADSDVDHAGRWPFSGRSMSDRDPTWRANYKAATTSGGEAGRGGPDSASSSRSGSGDASASYVAEVSRR